MLGDWARLQTTWLGSTLYEGEPKCTNFFFSPWLCNTALQRCLTFSRLKDPDLWVTLERHEWVKSHFNAVVFWWQGWLVFLQELGFVQLCYSSAKYKRTDPWTYEKTWISKWSHNCIWWYSGVTGSHSGVPLGTWLCSYVTNCAKIPKVHKDLALLTWGRHE